MTIGPNVEYAILQISDLHIFDNTEWNVMQQAYERLPHKDKVKCIVVTGDLHHFGKDYEHTTIFLNKVLNFYNLTKKDIFIVPGNHDSEKCDNKKEYTYFIENEVEKNADCYREYFVEGRLVDCFSNYNKFITSFYGEDKIYDKPEQVSVIQWKNKINFIHINTAINCNGNNKLNQIVDVYGLSNFYDSLNKNVPSIILAHHAIDKIHESHKMSLIRFITDWNVSAYLCGDAHKMQYVPIMTHAGSGTNIPCVVCGKSAPENEDEYSDLGCILYAKDQSSNKMFVLPFDWDKNQKSFTESHRFDTDQGKLDFNLLTTNKSEARINLNKTNFLSTKESIWLPDAEKAQGSQARFENFIETDIIHDFTTQSASFWGLSAVKGIGKTYVLQIKRRKITKDRLCLPIGIKPSVENGWGTDSVDISGVSNLNQLKDYNNAKLLWEYCILVYAINQLINVSNNVDQLDVWWDTDKPEEVLKRKIDEYFENGRICAETYDFCTNTDYSNLDTIVNNLFSYKNWTHFAENNLPTLYLIKKSIEIVLNDLKKTKLTIFIDKIDQSIPQASSEPPLDCSVCWKRQKTELCENKSEACKDKNTPCRIECCFGCEQYENPNTTLPLRVYNNSATYGHINIWQYIQIGLLHAVNNIKNKWGEVIEIYFTIREEAYSCEINLFGDKSKKITKLVNELWYSREEQHQIYDDCIRNQQDHLLFNPMLKNNADRLEEAFVGVGSLCHPYAKGVSETIFDSIYRHSFDRTRDIQEYGEFLTSHLNDIKKCQTVLERGELVKELIETKASELAFYVGNEKSIANKSYYIEKIPLLPNFWGNPYNFKRLIMMMPRNLLFAKDVRNICKNFNSLKRCPKNCENCEAKHHPFSMLYKLGMLGKINAFHEWKDNIEMDFLHSKQITYITGNNIDSISDDIIYLLHPALTKSIERLNKKVLHFNGFIIGKGLKVNKEKLNSLIYDYKHLTQKEYIEKYFYQRNI